MVKGFKHTELGLVPDDWSTIPLGKYAQLINGRAYSINEWELRGIPVIRLQNLTGNSETYYYSNLKLPDKQYCTYGDVLFMWSATFGPIIWRGGKAIYHYHIWKIETDKTNLSKLYLYYLLEDITQKLKSSSTNGGTMLHLTKGSMETMHIILPSTINEQTAIATVLADTDDLIGNLEKLIAKKRAIKHGAMQELFKPQKGWEERRLGNYAFITKLAGFEYSLHFNSYQDEGDIIVVRGTNITNNKLDLSDVKTIPTSVSKKLLRSKLYKNDLVFAYVGTIGPIFLIHENDKFHLGPNTAKITVNEELDSKYLFYFFTSSFIKNEINKHMSIGAQPSLSMAKIRNFKILFPPTISHQIKIAQILSDMDNEIQELERKLEKYKMLKQGIMQNLLTGKIRLI